MPDTTPQALTPEELKSARRAYKASAKFQSPEDAFIVRLLTTIAAKDAEIAEYKAETSLRKPDLFWDPEGEQGYDSIEEMADMIGGTENEFEVCTGFSGPTLHVKAIWSEDEARWICEMTPV